jgi:hypothetical protein
MSNMKLIKIIEGYSFYENPEPEIKQKIQEIPKPTHIAYHGSGKWVKTGVASNGNIIIESEEGDIQTILPNVYDNEIRNTHLKNINTAFPVKDIFNKHFVPFKRDNEILVEMVDNDYMFGRVGHIFHVKEWRIWDNKTNYINGSHTRNIRFTMSSSICSGNIYLTEEGNIANRDHNYNFNIKREFESFDDTIERLYSLLRAYPELEYSSGKWFTDKYVLKIETEIKHDFKLEVRQIPNQGSSYYIQGNSYSKTKRPKKKGEMVSSEHLVEAVKSLIEEHKGIIEN